MKITNQLLINVLNNLVEVNNDRILGYEKAISETHDINLQELFRYMASHSHTFRTRLSIEIFRLGGNPIETTSSSGKLFRTWMQIKAFVTMHDRRVILNSCRLLEESAIHAYSDALKVDYLSETIRQRIFQQKQELEQDLDQVDSLIQWCNGLLE